MPCEGRITSVSVCEISDSGETVSINPVSKEVSRPTSLTFVLVEKLEDGS